MAHQPINGRFDLMVNIGPDYFKLLIQIHTQIWQILITDVSFIDESYRFSAHFRKLHFTHLFGSHETYGRRYPQFGPEMVLYGFLQQGTVVVAPDDHKDIVSINAVGGHFNDIILNLFDFIEYFIKNPPKSIPHHTISTTDEGFAQSFE